MYGMYENLFYKEKNKLRKASLKLAIESCVRLSLLKESSQVSSWKELYNEALSVYEKYPYKNSDSKEFFSILHTRVERESIMFATHPTKEEREIYYAIENRSPSQVLKFIEKNYSDIAEDFPQDFSPKTLFDLTEFMRSNSKKLLTANKSADKLYSVLLTLYAFRYKLEKKNKPKKSRNYFQKCDCCWRLVPTSFMSGHRKVFCQYHIYSDLKTDLDPKKYAYANALEIMEDKNTLLLETKELKEKLFALSPISREKTGKMINWYNQYWFINPIEAEIHLPFELPWQDMEQILDLLPYIKASQKKEKSENDDFTQPKYLIEHLMPVYPESNSDEVENMQAYHRVWEKNFYTFIPELAYAETWLSQYYKKFGVHLTF